MREKATCPPARGCRTRLCFLQLSQSLTQLTSELLHLQTLVLIAEDMHDPYDVKAVLSQVKDISGALLKTIEDDRPSVNRVPSNCPTNNFVAVKAQELLNLYTSATPILRTIVSRS